MVNTIALIPARSGSKGVPNKNIKLLGEYTLLEWTIKTCLNCKLIDKVYVSTDSLKYAELARDAGAIVPFIRPNHLAKDTSTDFEFVCHALSWLEKNEKLPDYIVHMRPTTPLRQTNVVDKAIEIFTKNKNSTSLRSVHQMSESAYKTFEIDKNKILLKICSRDSNLDTANAARQSFPKTYVANGYVDVLSVSFIKETGLLHGNNVLSFETEQAWEVDTMEDFEYLEFKMSKDKAIFMDFNK